jgi:hypothetical protein
VAIVFPNPIILLILVFGGIETWRRWKARKTPEGQRYHRVSPAMRTAVAVVYVGLAVGLAVAMQATHLPRSIPSG